MPCSAWLHVAFDDMFYVELSSFLVLMIEDHELGCSPISILKEQRTQNNRFNDYLGLTLVLIII